MKLPLYCWSTEVNGYGIAFRRMLNIPHSLFLPFSSDHGTNLAGFLSKPEILMKPCTFLTFHDERYKSLTSQKYSKNILRAPNPWAYYRKSRKLKQHKSAKGTLIFLPHSLSYSENQVNLWHYICQVEAQNHPKPYCFVIHPNDVGSKAHITIQKSGFDWFCNGKNNSEKFIENFYGLVSKYENAVSSKPGSELYYCHDLGLFFQQIDSKVTEVTDNIELLRLRTQQSQDRCFNDAWNQQTALFTNPNSSQRSRDAFVDSILSRDLLDESFIRDLRTKIKNLYVREAPKYAMTIIQRRLGN